MRSTLLGATAVAVCLATAGVLAQKQLSLVATITDPNGGDVTAIDPKDVRVLENDVAATVLKVEALQRVPKLQVLVDNGSGMPSESIGDRRREAGDAATRQFSSTVRSSKSSSDFATLSR